MMSSSDRVTFRAAVFAIVKDDEGRVLLQRRAGTDFMDGYYDFPSGHVDADEGFATSLVREIREETSIIVDEKDLHLKHLNLNHTDYPYINAVFDVKKWQGKPQIMEADKCDDMRFFAIDNLPDKCTLAVRYIERAGFDEDGTTSYVDNSIFESLIGKSIEEVSF